MKIVIRVDASVLVGSGHVMRCLTLARRLQKQHGADVAFVMRDLAGNFINKVQANGFKVLVLPRVAEYQGLSGYEKWLTVPAERDAEDTLKVIKGYTASIDRLVVDSYALDYRWENRLRPITNEIMVIDDLANRKHDCDVLLDQNFYLNKSQRYKGLVPEHCSLLLGPEHALLREEFYEVKKHLRKRDGNVRHILVFYGGSDLTDETSKAIQALVLLHKEYNKISVDVVTGQSNPHKQKVEEMCSQHDFIRYDCQVDNMAELMNTADLMLGAGGTTTWERLFLQLPAIVTAIADNQIEICHDCAAAGLITYLGMAEDVNSTMIFSAISDVLSCKIRR